jgi:hypothetical protein
MIKSCREQYFLLGDNGQTMHCSLKREKKGLGGASLILMDHASEATQVCQAHDLLLPFCFFFNLYLITLKLINLKYIRYVILLNS